MAARRNEQGSKKGAWTTEEDAKLSQYIEIHAPSNPKKWKTIAAKSGVNRSGKSCRLRWLNYLRPNIKRGNISDDEEDLIIRLHNLLGNRWSLIAGRIPGRTDNEIKNYWNSYLSKKIPKQHQQQQQKKKKKKKKKDEAPPPPPAPEETPISSLKPSWPEVVEEDEGENYYDQLGGAIFDDVINFDVDDDIFHNFSDMNRSLGLDWVDDFLQLDEEVQLGTKDEDPAR